MRRLTWALPLGVTILLLVAASASLPAGAQSAFGLSTVVPPPPVAEDRHLLIRVDVYSSDDALKKQVEDSLWIGLKSMSGDGVVLDTEFDFAADHIELDVMAERFKDCDGAAAISTCLYEAGKDARQPGSSTPSRSVVMMSHGLSTCNRKELPKESERLGTKVVEQLVPDLALEKHKRRLGH